jgi:hypothetical protein
MRAGKHNKKTQIVRKKDQTGHLKAAAQGNLKN